MEQGARHRAERKHLLTDEQLASHAGASAEDLAQGHRQGNAIRIHRTYIVIVSLAALVLLVVAIAVASATM
jgi:hypothetical protein